MKYLAHQTLESERFLLTDPHSANNQLVSDKSTKDTDRLDFDGINGLLDRLPLEFKTFVNTCAKNGPVPCSAEVLKAWFPVHEHGKMPLSQLVGLLNYQQQPI